jgi:hypothetical protein
MRTALALLAALMLAPPAFAQEDDDAIGEILMRGTEHPERALGEAQPDVTPEPVIVPEPMPPPNAQAAVTPPTRAAASAAAALPPPPPAFSGTVAEAQPPATLSAASPPPRPAYSPPAPPPSPPALAARPQTRNGALYEPGAPPDGAPTSRDLTYEGRVRTTFASAQGLQGQMDGGWVLVSPRSERLYSLQIVDRGDGSGLEGAWRDLRRPRGALGAVGLIDSIGLDGGGLSIRFRPRSGAEPLTLSLTPSPEGGWSGEASGFEHGRMTLRRP